MRSAPYVTVETLAKRTRAWLAAARSAAVPRPHLQLTPPRCALLLVDMLHYFAAPEGRCYLPATAAVTPRIAALLAAWRRLGAPVIFTRHGHTGETDLGMLGRFYSDYIRAGEPEAEIIPALTPAAGESVLAKTTYDAFLGTPLEGLLRDSGCRQVLITGVLTHMCCETTARAAFCRGFEVYLAADAMASSSEERHVGSLLAMADAVAVVLSSAEVLELCPSTMS